MVCWLLRNGDYMPAHCLRVRRKRITCNDGTTLSVQVGEHMYCTPRNNDGEYSEVEVSFIQDSEEKPYIPPNSWEQYSDGSFPSDVYGYVPVALVEEFIASHGGRKFWV